MELIVQGFPFHRMRAHSEHMTNSGSCVLPNHTLRRRRLDIPGWGKRNTQEFAVEPEDFEDDLFQSLHFTHKYLETQWD